MILRGTTPLIIIYPNDWIVESAAEVTHRRWIAWDMFRERRIQRFRSVQVLQLGEQTWHVVDQHGRSLAKVALIVADAAKSLHIQIESSASGVNRIGFAWWAPTEECLYGFGAYGNGPAMSGKWSTWTEEGPVGLGPLSPWLRWTGWVPLPKGHHSTYAPSPSWLSSLGYGAWLDNTERVDWTRRGARRTVRVWGNRLSLHLVAGQDLKQVIQRRSEVLGVPPLPPPWVFGPWIDAVRGENHVCRTADALRQADIPASAIWIEDWMGSWENARRFWMRPLSHVASPELYPHLERMATRLHRQGFKLLGYFCPEIAEGTPLYHEAQEGNHLVRDHTGKPVDIVILGRHHGELDLTRPQTCQWVERRVLEPLEHVGFDGWMADFGEYLPVESVLADGTTGWESHNRYPVLWQTVHRQFWERMRPDGDYTFFARSAGLETPRLTPVMWGGDSDTDWDRADGLPTVVPQALSAGLTGNVFWATDIAGYMTLGLTRPSTKELYIRWTEVAALFPVMRTHHGTARPRNWHWQRDVQTEEVFARYTRLHALLFPYFFTLAHQAHETGTPLVRPLFLEYPGATYARVNTEFMLGPHLLAAPVTKPRRSRWTVLLPKGRWLDWWSGRWYRGPAAVDVPAPLDRLPLFLREGAMLPLAEGTGPHPLGFVRTLADADGLHAVSSTLTVLLAGRPLESSVVNLPSGILRARPVHSKDHSQSGSRLALPPRTTGHAPLLDRVGVAVSLHPQVPKTVSSVEWTWHGDQPLDLIIRSVEDGA